MKCSQLPWAECRVGKFHTVSCKIQILTTPRGDKRVELNPRWTLGYPCSTIQSLTTPNGDFILIF